MEEDKRLNDCQRDYLALIQGVINRMASSSVAIKGFAATIFAGVLAIVISVQSSQYFLALSVAIVAVCISFLFDWYYYFQEKQYRALYDEVRRGMHACDFDMAAPRYTRITRRGSLKSFSLWAYYGTLELILILISICPFMSNLAV